MMAISAIVKRKKDFSFRYYNNNQAKMPKKFLSEDTMPLLDQNIVVSDSQTKRK